MHVCKELVPFIWTAHILRHGISPRWYVMSERKQNIFGLEKVASHPNFGLGIGMSDLGGRGVGRTPHTFVPPFYSPPPMDLADPGTVC